LLCRNCPRGDDPGTYDDHVEVQVLQCIADGGSFQLGFRQAITGDIPFNSDAAFIKAALEGLETLSTLTVTFSPGASAACNPSGTAFIRISFDTTHADLPALKRYTSNLIDDTNANGNPGTGTIAIATDGSTLGPFTSIRGTTENAYCNNRGQFFFIPPY
jgi:hypothetical protein